MSKVIETKCTQKAEGLLIADEVKIKDKSFKQDGVNQAMKIGKVMHSDTTVKCVHIKSGVKYAK